MVINQFQQANVNFLTLIFNLEIDEDKAMGSLLGSLIGHAVGVPLMFKDIREINDPLIS
jgi:hypothetical protein